MAPNDRVALVTGAASGIGKAIAEAYAGHGMYVIVCDVDDAATRVANGIGGMFIEADLSDRESVQNLARQAMNVKGHVDILVNNAGYQHVAAIEEFPEDVWQSMLNVMLTAPFQLCKYLLPKMKQRGWGRVINISSLHGLVASPFKCAYISAKHGLLGLTKTVALEVANYGITVNAICPAYVRTPLVEKQLKAQAETHGISEAEVIDKIMLEPAAIKHLIEPAEVAEFAVYLTSEKARSMTGAAHMMDLGWTAR